MGDYPERIAGFFGDVFRQARDRAVGNMFSDGFNEAADIAITTVQANIDALMGKIRQGKSLTKDEQVVLDRLTQLKSELDTAFRKFWEDAAATEER